MAADAIRGYLEVLAKDGLPFPVEDAEPGASAGSMQASRDPSSRAVAETLNLVFADFSVPFIR